jgi:Ala-tRNA(Pro) deacylase
MERDVYSLIKDYFHHNDVAYQEINHAPAAATEEYHQALGCRYEQQAKCLLLKISDPEGSRFVICTIPAQKKVDFKQLRQLLHAKKVQFASQAELKTVTGCNFGELPPLGKIFGLQLLMEADLLQEEEIFLNAGRLDVSFVVNPGDIARLEKPLLFLIPEVVVSG